MAFDELPNNANRDLPVLRIRRQNMGPQYMKDRPAYKLKEALLVYNLFQIVSNGWLFYELGRYGWLSGNYSFTCQPVDYSNSESALRMLRASYLFYILKFFDLIDTLFFVLRKKFSQITTLHVIHHGLIVVNTWPGARFVFGGHATFFIFLNTFVHAACTFYYFMAAMGPRYQKFLGWKKHLTTLQITQFVVGLIHCFQLIFIECDFPVAYCWWIGCHQLLFLYLFIKFYKNLTLFNLKSHRRRTKMARINENIAF